MDMKSFMKHARGNHGGVAFITWRFDSCRETIVCKH